MAMGIVMRRESWLHSSSFSKEVQYTIDESLLNTNKQGGMKSTTVCVDAVNLWNWCIAQKIMFSADYLPGTHHVIEESLSRRFITNHK